jgi:hypothetical protein
VAQAPLQQALAALTRPLAFAASEDFAKLARVRDLEGGVRAACEAVLKLGLPSDLRRDLDKVVELFAAPLPEDERITAIRRTLALLEPCRAEDWGSLLLSRNLSSLSGVGPKREEAFAKRGLAAVGDLVFFLPARYEDRRSLAQIADLEVGRRATFIAEVKSVGGSTHRGRRRFHA